MSHSVKISEYIRYYIEHIDSFQTSIITWWPSISNRYYLRSRKYSFITLILDRIIWYSKNEHFKCYRVDGYSTYFIYLYTCLPNTKIKSSSQYVGILSVIGEEKKTKFLFLYIWILSHKQSNEASKRQGISEGKEYEKKPMT